MFPVVLDVSRLRVALVGDGKAAERRLALIEASGAEHVRVFSEAPSEALRAAAGDRLVGRLPEGPDLDATDVLFIAEIEGAEALVDAARARRVLVNTEDVRHLCDFHVPATVRRGDLLLTVSTGGASPGLARRLRLHLEKLFGAEWAGRLNEIATARQRWRDEGASFSDLAKRTDAMIDEKGWLA